jgi:hypothetical protein
MDSSVKLTTGRRGALEVDRELGRFPQQLGKGARIAF